MVDVRAPVRACCGGGQYERKVEMWISAHPLSASSAAVSVSVEKVVVVVLSPSPSMHAVVVVNMRERWWAAQAAVVVRHCGSARGGRANNVSLDALQWWSYIIVGKSSKRVT